MVPVRALSFQWKSAGSGWNQLSAVLTLLSRNTEGLPLAGLFVLSHTHMRSVRHGNTTYTHTTKQMCWANAIGNTNTIYAPYGFYATRISTIFSCKASFFFVFVTLVSCHFRWILFVVAALHTRSSAHCFVTISEQRKIISIWFKVIDFGN